MYRVTSWFDALSRLRQLIPGDREEPDLELLSSPYRIAAALESAGIVVTWQPASGDADFPPNVMSAPFHGIAVADSLLARGFPAIEVTVPTLTEIDRELRVFDGDESVLLSLA